jgi:hypothetical protein
MVDITIAIRAVLAALTALFAGTISWIHELLPALFP